MTQFSILNERRLPTLPAFAAHAVVPYSLTPTCMTTTLSRIIPKLTDDGDLVEIPRSAWEDIILIAEEEFNGEISLHDHDAAGSFHDLPFVPVPHYLVEVTLDEDRADEFIERVEPLVLQLTERHTQQPLVPAGA